MTTVGLDVPSRRERKKAAARADIIASGIALFSEHGIDAVTVEQVAAAANVGKGTIYNHFNTKEDIVVAFMVELERKVQAKLKNFSLGKAPLEGILSDFIRAQFALKKRHYRFVRMFFGQMFFNTEHFMPYMVEVQRTIDPLLETLFGALQKRGAVRADVSVPDMIQAFKTIHLGLTALWAVEGPPFRGTERTLRIEMKLLCEGLKAKHV